MDHVCGDSLKSISILVEELVPIAALHQTDEALTDDEKQLENDRPTGRRSGRPNEDDVEDESNIVEDTVTGDRLKTFFRSRVQPKSRPRIEAETVHSSRLPEVETEAMRAARLSRLAVRRDGAFRRFADCYLEDEDDEDDDYEEEENNNEQEDGYDDELEGGRDRLNKTRQPRREALSEEDDDEEDEEEDDEEDIENWNSEDDTSSSDEDSLTRGKGRQLADEDEDEDDSFDSGASEDSGGISSRDRASQAQRGRRCTDFVAETQSMLTSGLADISSLAGSNQLRPQQHQLLQVQQAHSLQSQSMHMGRSTSLGATSWSRKAVASGASKRARVITYHGDGSADTLFGTTSSSPHMTHHAQNRVQVYHLPQQQANLNVFMQPCQPASVTGSQTPLLHVQMPRTLRPPISTTSISSISNTCQQNPLIMTSPRLTPLVSGVGFAGTSASASASTSVVSTASSISPLPTQLGLGPQTLATGLASGSGAVRIVSLPSHHASSPVSTSISANIGGPNTTAISSLVPTAVHTPVLVSSAPCLVSGSTSSSICLGSPTTTITTSTAVIPTSSIDNKNNSIVTLDSSFMPLQMVQSAGSPVVAKLTQLQSQPLVPSFTLQPSCLPGAPLTLFSSSHRAPAIIAPRPGSPVSGSLSLPLATSCLLPGSPMGPQQQAQMSRQTPPTSVTFSLNLAGPSPTGLIAQPGGHVLAPISSTTCTSVTNATAVCAPGVSTTQLLTSGLPQHATVFSLANHQSSPQTQQLHQQPVSLATASPCPTGTVAIALSHNLPPNCLTTPQGHLVTSTSSLRGGVHPGPTLLLPLAPAAAQSLHSVVQLQTLQSTSLPVGLASLPSEPLATAAGSGVGPARFLIAEPASTVSLLPHLSQQQPLTASLGHVIAPSIGPFLASQGPTCFPGPRMAGGQQMFRFK